ncbi:outer dynein arm-docking complex subunit 4-like isoform X5 [Crassostrea virginica]
MPRRGGSDHGSENQELVGTFETLRDEGEHFVHVKLWQKAIDSFTRAIEMNPEEKKCYVTRSKCWLQLGNAENALTDAEEALRQDKEYIPGLYQKAEAMYQLGDFETSLVFFHRGHKLRPELQEFRLGIQKAQEAINNSIGKPDSVKLTADGDLTYFYKQEEDEKAKAKAKKTGGTYGKPGAKKETAKERQKPQASGDQKTIKQLLGELYGDKDFLEKLLSEDSLTSDNNPTNKDIREKIYDGLEYLHARADFWRQQKPMYARKRDKAKQRQSAKARNQDPTSYLLRCLEDIDDDQSKERYEESLQKAKKTLKTVENMNEDQLQNKAEILANIHSQIGNAYLELGKYNESLKHHEEDLKISKENDLEDARSRALDNLGRVHARKGNFDKAIEVWEEKLPMSKSPLESTWLYHEIGRCYLELQRYQDARDFGEKAIQAAKEAEDDGWQLHASVLVAQSEVKLGDLQSAAESFERSLDIAKKLNDGPAESAIKKAMEEVNSRIVQGVKEGDDKDDDDDKGSVKSDKDRKGATSQQASDNQDEEYADDFEKDQEESSSKPGSRSNSRSEEVSKKQSSESKPEESSSPDENNTDKPAGSPSPEQPQSPLKVKVTTSSRKESKKGAEKRKVSKESQKSTKSNQESKPDQQRKTFKVSNKGKTSPPTKKNSTQEKKLSNEKKESVGKKGSTDKKESVGKKDSTETKKGTTEKAGKEDTDDENDEIRKVSEANSKVDLYEGEGDEAGETETKPTQQQKKSSDGPTKKKSSQSPYVASTKKSSNSSIKSKNSTNSNGRGEEKTKEEKEDNVEEDQLRSQETEAGIEDQEDKENQSTDQDTANEDKAESSTERRAAQEPTTQTKGNHEQAVSSSPAETTVQMVSEEDSVVPLETREQDSNVEVEPYDTEASEKGLGYDHPFEIKRKGKEEGEEEGQKS